jgi:hypothetical protein
MEGLLKPTGAVHTGTGRNRTFGTDEILRAAILFECARWDVTVGTMESLLQELAKEQKELSLVDYVKKSSAASMKFSVSGWPPRYEIVSGRSMPAGSRSLLCIDLKRLLADLDL